MGIHLQNQQGMVEKLIMFSWPKKQVKNVSHPSLLLTQTLTPESLSYQPSEPCAEWLYQPHVFKQTETVALLAQLEEQGYATYSNDVLHITWQDFYTFKKNPDFEDLNNLLLLPNDVILRPSLQSKDGLEDASFRIMLGDWFDANNQRLTTPPTTMGGVATYGSQQGVINENLWHLLSAIKTLSRIEASQRTGLINRRAWATIRRYALATEAHLADFLLKTIVLTPEKIQLKLNKSEILGIKTIQVEPLFTDAPTNWLAYFDRMPQVLDSYNVVDGQGLTQVIISPQVKEVLQEIRRWPNRRIAGQRAEAFIRNPFAALGEMATEVIDETHFNEARVAADITFEHFQVEVKHSTQGDVIGVDLVIDSNNTYEHYTFAHSDELSQFIRLFSESINADFQCFSWQGYELEILGDAEFQLIQLRQAHAQWLHPQTRMIRYADVYDLSQYSSRVTNIGIEKPYYSPFIARKDDSESWIPENIDFGVFYTPEGSDTPIYIVLTHEQLDELQEEVDAAQKSRQTYIKFSHIDENQPILAQEAANILSSIKGANRGFPEGELPKTKANVKTTPQTLIIEGNIEKQEYSENRADILAFPSNTQPVLPQSIKATTQLKTHQHQGVAWLQHLWKYSPSHVRGALLADDMGLGKTLQLLTFILNCLEKDTHLEPVLIVAPVTLLENWQAELHKFFEATHLSVLVLYGDELKSKRAHKNQIDEQLQQNGLVKFLQPNWFGNARIVLTTYETLRDLEFSFAAQKWSIMVCDEAQKIKNPNALMTRAAKKQNVRFKIACTGTPVENSLTDLWCLFDFVQSGLLGALNEFRTCYSRPIEAKTDEEKARVDCLRQLIEPQTLRRTKADVAKDLPRKIIIQDCQQLDISPLQRSFYSHAVQCYKQRATDNNSPFKNHLGLIQYLRRLCTDPQAIGQRSHLNDPANEYMSKSPKMKWLISTLSDIKNRAEKVIIFVELHDLQRLLQHYIKQQFDIYPTIINGTSATVGKNDNSRQKRIDIFQQQHGFNVIILSPLAVGFGVNIQAANHVIHYTRTWNPAKEDQATDRAYRIGQTKDVYVYYPIVTADFTTFDMKLNQLLTWKRELSHDMLNGCGDLSLSDFGDLESPSGTNVFIDELLTENDIAIFEANTLEVFCAVLWGKIGYSMVYKTPQSGDGGVDVVAIRGTEGVLIQCKSSLNDGLKHGWEAVKDVVAGEAAYRQKHPNVEFKKIAVSNQCFNDTAYRQAKANNVELIDRNSIAKLLNQYPIKQLELNMFVATR